jgi:capsid protein
MRAGLVSLPEAISAAEDVDAEIAADNRRADGLGLMFDSHPRRGPAGGASAQAKPQTETPASDGAAA